MNTNERNATRRKRVRRVILGLSPLLLLAGLVSGGALTDNNSTIAHNVFEIPGKGDWKTEKEKHDKHNDNPDNPDLTENSVTLKGDPFDVRFDPSNKEDSKNWMITNLGTHAVHTSLAPKASASHAYGAEAANIKITYIVGGQSKPGGTLKAPTPLKEDLQAAKSKDAHTQVPVTVKAEYTGAGAGADNNKEAELDVADFALNYVQSAKPVVP